MSKLRAVTRGERAFKKMTVIEAAQSGTHQDLLRALRNRLAAAIEDPAAHPRDIANLARQLAAVSESLQVGTGLLRVIRLVWPRRLRMSRGARCRAVFLILVCVTTQGHSLPLRDWG